MRTVFVIQNVEGKNLLPAKDYGEITIVLSGKETPDIASEKLRRSFESMRADDYLLLIGHPLNIGIACHLAFCKFPVVNFLVWDRDHYRYNRQLVCL
ncbi:hypothetical protein [Caudoviricetes sp.]|nr:hypothetical protein [Caudoviricetes sp.]